MPAGHRWLAGGCLLGAVEWQWNGSGCWCLLGLVEGWWQWRLAEHSVRWSACDEGYWAWDCLGKGRALGACGDSAHRGGVGVRSRGVPARSRGSCPGAGAGPGAPPCPRQLLPGPDCWSFGDGGSVCCPGGCPRSPRLRGPWWGWGSVGGPARGPAKCHAKCRRQERRRPAVALCSVPLRYAPEVAWPPRGRSSGPTPQLPASTLPDRQAPQEPTGTLATQHTPGGAKTCT